MLVLDKNVSIRKDDILINEVIKYKDNRFQLTYVNRNGSKSSTIKIYTQNCDLKQIASERDVDENVTSSYFSGVSNENEARKECKRIFDKFKSYLIRIF